MKVPQNIREIIELQPDYMGFIFYSKSPRFAGTLDPAIALSIPETICKVGVFVNETPEIITGRAQRYGIHTVQLHGNETPDTCKKLKNNGLTVIKAISISNIADLAAADPYQTCCDYLLFDTKTPLYGGSGEQYDWSILTNYQGILPFFLSGGIGPGDADRILAFSHPKLKAIDINSRFETAPGLKNATSLKLFLQTLRTNI